MQAESQVQEHAAEAVETAAEGFNAGEVIIEHVANSSLEHPLIHLPTIAGIDFSVTKHVFMLWLVAALVFDLRPYLVSRLHRIGYHALNLVFAYLTAIYIWAAVHGFCL